ncbi:MAG: hypothetical protein IJY48_00935, partial [Mailhella sp.]|nr:hypothetical protein [Mailhella sp.]
AVFFCPNDGMAQNSPAISPDGTEASVTLAAFDPLANVLFAAPREFQELSPDSPLFQQSAAEAVRHGRLLKLYLPRHLASQYRSGSPDAVTRQVLVCALKNQTSPLLDKEKELLARSAEGFFVGFSRIPHSRTDTPAQSEENRARALSISLEKGSPLLVESVRTSSAYLHTCLIHFSMTSSQKTEKQERAWLPCALALAAVPVKDTMLFITVSSLLGQDSAESHLTWVKETASTFADAIVKANAPEKKK